MAKLPFPSEGGNPVAEHPMDVWQPTTDAESMTDGAPDGLIPMVPETPKPMGAAGDAFFKDGFAPSDAQESVEAAAARQALKPHPEAGDGD